MSNFLFAVTVLPGSRMERIVPEEAKNRLRDFMIQEQLLDANCGVEDLCKYIFRLILTPFPLTLSIASAFVPYATEVRLENSSASNESEFAQWLESLAAARKQGPAVSPGTYMSGIPTDSPSISLLITTTDIYAQLKPSATSLYRSALQWPVIRTAPQTSMVVGQENFLPEEAKLEESQPPSRYFDDVLAARLTVKVMKGVEQVIADKRREIEQSGKSVDITTQFSSAVAQGLKDLQAQLMVKDLPQLQLKSLKLEEDKTVAQQLNTFTETTRKLLTELGKLKEQLQDF